MKKASSPPSHLSPEAKKLWADLRAEFMLDDPAGRLLLQSALEAFDRLQEARKILAKEGAVVRDRWNQAKVHPAVAVEASARQGMHAALRLMKLAPDALED